MAWPPMGFKLRRDYTSVIEVTKDENADRYNLLRIVGEHTVFSHQKPAVPCLCIQHLLGQAAEFDIPLTLFYTPRG